MQKYIKIRGRGLIFRPSIPSTVAFLMVSLFLFIIGLVATSTSVRIGQSWPIYISFLSLVWAGFYVAATYASFNSIYLFSSAYLISLFVFHLSIPLLQTLTIIDYESWVKGGFAKWVETAGWYFVLALGSYGIGSCLSLMSSKPRAKLFLPNSAEEIRAKSVVKWQSYGLLVASLLFFILAIRSYGNLLEYQRQELYSSNADSRGLRVFMMVFPGATLALAIAAVRQRDKIIGYSLLAFSILIFLLSGFRSAALFSALVGVVCWVKSGRNFPVWVAVISVIVVLIAISVVGIFRQMGAYSALSAEDLKASYQSSSIERSLVEMGQALGVAAYVFEFVPEEDDFIYGSSYIRALREMVPNISRSVDSSDSRGGLGDNLKLGQEVLSDMAPSDWLTYKIKRDQFDKGGGVGFSTLAEPYLNFGAAGVICFFLVLGYLLLQLDKVDLVASPLAMLFACSMLWPLMRTVRNDFSNFLKPLGFMIIIIIIWNICLRLCGKRSLLPI